MENQAGEQQSYEDVQKSGYLRKHKSMHRRFFVLRAASEHGPARLEYYENEKKFRSKSPIPKKTLNLETCFNINKRADSKNKHMIVLYTRSESFAIAADTEDVQNEWYQAMLDLQGNCTPEDCGSSGECSSPSPIPTFKEVWQVKVWPKGLGHARNLVGIYRLCLTDKTVNFVKLNSDMASVVLQLMNVRRCGHSENFFFIEVGRSAITGPGEFWMQVDDSVVAQNMHETLLEAMKALSEEFRQRSKSQSVGTSCGGGTASNPISVPSRRHHPNLPPSQVGFSRRSRTETPGTGGGSSTSTSPTSRHGFPRARTASIGARSEEGGAACGKGTWASSSPSLNGSCSTTPTLRPKPTRAPTPAKITLSLARYTPNPTPSPAPSLSSSSGHGSECGLVGASAVGGMSICSYARAAPQRVSVSGSPSDYGSSDEYGSSPGEHSLLVPGGPRGHHHPGYGDSLAGYGPAGYIVMGQREALLGPRQRHKGRRMLRRSSSREREAGRRLLSKRASLPAAVPHDRLASRKKDEEDEEDEEEGGEEEGVRGGDEEEYAVMSRGGAGSLGAEPGCPPDTGYMSMLPGVTSPPASLLLSGCSDRGAGDEYMAMTPSSNSSPRPIRQPSGEGYMLMSPNSNCPAGASSAEGRAAIAARTGDYMNASPVCSRSACSTPPSHPEQHQPHPKMLHSYFSLPRAYQHTLCTRFEDDLGQGKGKPEGGAGHEPRHPGRVAGFIKRNKAGAASSGGGVRKLSLSSSSFSSSSASSESLEEKSLSAVVAGRGLSLLRPLEGASPKDVRRHPKRTSSCKSPQRQRAQGWPAGVPADTSKANTLPRAKENLLPSATPNVGEYVSIVYRGEGGQGTRQGSGALRPAAHRPSCCPDNPSNLPRSFSAPLSTSSEYVSMDLGRGASAVAPQSRDEGNRSSLLTGEELSGYRTNAPMGVVPAELSLTGTNFHKGSEPSDQCSRPAMHPGSPLEQEPGFSPVRSFSSPDRGSRLVRGDQQGQRPHRSEAFMPPPSLALHASPSTALYPEGSQAAAHRHGLDCTLWDNGQAAGSAHPQPLSTEQGLNYIDLDLAKEGPQAGNEYATAAYNVGVVGASAGSSLNTYASIDFYKSEEQRAHHNNSKKDGQD